MALPGFTNYTATVSIILLIFYLYVLARYHHVKRPLCFLVGVGAIIAQLLILGLFSSFIEMDVGGWNWAWYLVNVIGALLNVVAFGSLVWAAYGGMLPMKWGVSEETMEHPGGAGKEEEKTAKKSSGGGQQG